MSGYLQRMVVGSVARRQKVHPLVSSMYVSERDLGLAEQGAGPIVVNETRVPKPAASVSSRGDAAEARVEVERAAPAAPHEPPRRSKYEEAVSAQAEGGIFQPLLPERIERAPVRRVVAKADHGLRTTAAVSGGREEASAGLMKAPVPGNDEPASSAKSATTAGDLANNDPSSGLPS